LPYLNAIGRDKKLYSLMRGPLSSIAILWLASNHVAHVSPSSPTVRAHVKAKPGKEVEMRKELLSLVAPSRKDAGCINYDLHEGKDNPAVFVFHENWASQAHLDAHLQKPDLQAVLGAG
jgi:quinol monooxygenase YgiN